MFLAIFEFLGTSELLIILVVALLLFGPRKLPQMSRQLGKSLGEFKRASEDFKRTWEKEVEMEKLEEEGRMARAMLQDDQSFVTDASDKREALDAASDAASSDTHLADDDWGVNQTLQPTVARSNSATSAEETPAALAPEVTAQETTGKRDWL